MSERLAFKGKVEVEGRRIRGAVQLAGQRTRRGGEWLEIDPAAIVKADISRLVGRFEHDPHKILGRPDNGTLQLSRSDQGIEYELSRIPRTTFGDDALELVREGYVTGSSFEIEGPFRYAIYDDPESGERVRRITHIASLTDVSPVGDPAFEASSAQAFSAESPATGAPVAVDRETLNRQGEPMTEPIVEPVAPPAPPAPVITPVAPNDDKSDTYRVAEAFARKQDKYGLERSMANLIADWNPASADAYDAFAKVYDEITAAEGKASDNATRLKLAHALRTGKGPKAPANREETESEDYKHAFGKYIRSGDKGVMEQFAQSIAGTGAEGGFAVPESFLSKITETQAAFGGIQQHADIVETGDGRALPWPTNNDTANSAAVADEGSAPGSGGADLVFGEVSLGAFSIAATGTGNAPLKVSWELLQDSQFDFEAFVARKLGERLGRKAAALYANGVGTTEPLGLLAKSADVMSATKMYAALVEHMFQVNEAYRNSGNCRWIMSDTTLTKVYGSVDLNGRPLFQPSGQAGGQGAPAGTLLGFPVQLDQAAAGLVAFGDIKQGYVIRRVRGVQVVVDPYNNTATRQNAYHAWMRTDAAVQDSAAYSVSDYASVTADAAGS